MHMVLARSGSRNYGGKKRGGGVISKVTVTPPAKLILNVHEWTIGHE